ncbi:hypothetical protein HLK59_20470 [Streptomyces sp. S3(2020)]|uniref:hypothetical protein n=1 Tax=Streptomyces sp. S3(2020) TaxID=2732044 RepID=UPI00148A05AD|nr:hypothetical protein [Streptomyces sp. S3(2020)]NNN32696.1 hypothetical protein [Streptomyces sp. S3(2020)]
MNSVSAGGDRPTAQAPTWPGPQADDDRETASVPFALLGEEELAEVRERAAHANEVVTGLRSGSKELPGPGEPRPQHTATVSKLPR